MGAVVGTIPRRRPWRRRCDAIKLRSFFWTYARGGGSWLVWFFVGRLTRCRSLSAMTGIEKHDFGDVNLDDPILDAALAELMHPTVAAFSDKQVAARAGVDVREIRKRWPNTRELLGATLDAYFDGRLPVPDTGSLRGDLRVFAGWIAGVYNTADGRRVLDALIGRPSDWDLSGARQALLDVRTRRYEVLFGRAIERGECAPDVDIGKLLDLLAIGTALPLIFHDRPVTDDDVFFVVDTLLDGVALPGTTEE